jgi:hypothetical protein
MAGLLQSAEQGAKPQGTPNYDEMLADMEMRIPDHLREGWDRLMAAGMKFLFDKSTNPMVNEYLEGEGDMATKLGEGTAGMVIMITKEARGALPGELIIPGGIALMIETIKYMKKSGMYEVSAEELAGAIEIFMSKTLGQFGVSEDQFSQTLEMAAQDQPQAGVMQ